MVCSRNNAYLFEHSPYIDQLYFVRTKNIGDYLACGKQLAKEQYDVVIDPTVTLRNRDLLFLRTMNAKAYIGYDKSDYKILLRAYRMSGNISLKYINRHWNLPVLQILIRNMMCRKTKTVRER